MLAFAAPASADFRFITQWGGPPNGQFSSPQDVATDRLGNFYVADNGQESSVNGGVRIQKFDSSGRFLAKWGSYGQGDGQFTFPVSVATDSAGNVYVTDAQNDEEFRSCGTCLKRWPGPGDRLLQDPRGIATDGAGHVYVADSGHERIVKYDSSGTFLGAWGSAGSGDGQFMAPLGVATDIVGNVYVADLGNHRIQKFDSSGTFLTKWGSQGTGDGQFNHPRDVATDASGHVFVADLGNDRVQEFDSSGTFINKWGTSGSGNGDFTRVVGLDTDTAGNVYTAEEFRGGIFEPGNNRIQKFSSSGSFLLKVGGPVPPFDGQLLTPSRAATDSAGNLYVTDTGNYRVQKFDSSGRFLAKWGSRGSADGQFSDPRGLAVDGQGNVYVGDSSRIEKFDSSGTFLTKWGSYGPGDGQFEEPRGVATDGAGNVYVADTYNDRVQKFDSSGNFLAKWGSYGFSNGQFYRPQGIATDAAGNVYVADTLNGRVQKFSSSGAFLTSWNLPDAGAKPIGITTDGAGNVYVGDWANSKIDEFTSSGTLLRAWGSGGSGEGRFKGPEGVAVDGYGNAFVADTGNSLIQKFGDLGYRTPVGASALELGFVPAFKPCETPDADSRHGAPLDFASCANPTPTSSTVEVGPNTLSIARMVVCPAGSTTPFCNPAGGAMPKPDVRITGSIRDVRCQGTVPAGCTPSGDYDPDSRAGPYTDGGNGKSGAQPPCFPSPSSATDCIAGSDLTEVAALPGATIGATGTPFEGRGIRITDNANGTSQSVAATMVDVGFPIPLDCLPTTDSSQGSTCGVNTTANALAPGVVRSGSAAVWQIGQVELRDSGPDGVRGNSDDELFAVQGVFLP